MTFQPFFISSLIIGFLSSIIGCFYSYFFNTELFDFSGIIPFWKIVAVYFSLSLFLSGIHFLLFKYLSKYGKVAFNLIFAFGTIISIIIPISAKIKNVEFPEFYPIFAIPLHLIFGVIFLAIEPLIIKTK